MTNEYKELKPVLDTLEHAFNTLGINYYLIGAFARQIRYNQAKIPYRATKDIDYAVLVGSSNEYQTIKDYLVTHAKYVESKNNAFVLTSAEGLQIDILPFGEIEQQGIVNISGTGMTSIKVDGMKEVYEFGTERVELDTGNSFRVATLPGILLLKLIAYDDRPEQRQKDAIDIGNIIMNFFLLHDTIIYDFHNDLFEQERNLENISAIVIGREMKKITGINSSLFNRLENILNIHISTSDDSKLVRLMVNETRKNVTEVTSYLSDIAWGLNNPSNIQ